MSETGLLHPPAPRAPFHPGRLAWTAVPPRLRRRCLVAAVLMGADLASGYAGVESLGVLIRSGFNMGMWALPVLVAGYGALGLYEGLGPCPFERLRLRARGIALLIVADTAIGFIMGQEVPAAFVVFGALGLLLVGHYVEVCARTILIRRGIWGGTLVFVGISKASAQLAGFLQAHPEFGLRPIGSVQVGQEDTEQMPPSLPSLGMVADLERLASWIEVLVFRSATEALLLNPRLARRLHTKQLVMIGDPHDFPSLWLRTRSIGGLIGIELRQNARRVTWRFKRLVDLTVAVPACVFAAPFILLATLAIKAVDPGPAFYFHNRIGKDGQSIRIFKLRTIFTDAESRLEEHLAGDPEARAEWQKFFKLKRDPRILPFVGRLLRRTSVDELPQLLNVLLGTMSLVGPRPFPPYHVHSFDHEFQDVRCRVPPGLSGLWQVAARSDGDLEVQRDQDLFYILNWSIWLDFYILLETPIAVIAGRGAR
jgi:Undecaprenyl-phosphate galactose phosphotransferase WbaP